MRLSMFAEPAPETAEVCGNLKFHRYEANGVLYVKAWRGQQSKPYAHYRFRDAARAAQWIADQVTANQVHVERLATRKAEDADARARLVEAIQVGTLLHYAWGWEQTQCEFFQVVEKRGGVVYIRPIQSQVVDGSEQSHGMADMRRPAPGCFCGEPIRKVIGSHGLKMPHGTATITTADQQHYCSWYA